MDTATSGPLLTRLRVKDAVVAGLRTSRDGDAGVVPVVAVWVDGLDLSVTGQMGVEGASHALAAVEINPAGAVVELVLAPMGVSPDVFWSTCGAGWEVEVPTVLLALTVERNGAGDPLQLVLLSGDAPVDPSGLVLPAEAVDAVVWVNPDEVATALEFLAERWRVPGTPAPVVSKAVPARDLMWQACSSLALGHASGLYQLQEYAKGVDAERLPFSWDAVGDMLNEAVVSAGLAGLLSGSSDLVVPFQMSKVSDHIHGSVPEVVVRGLAGSCSFGDLADAVGPRDAFVASGVVLAVGAARIVERALRDVPGGSSALLARWLGGDPKDLWWTGRASIPAMLMHDTTVLADLLASVEKVDKAIQPLSWRWVHVLADALAASTLTSDKLKQAFSELDVQPAYMSAVVGLCASLLDASDGAARLPGCVPCAAATAVLSRTPDDHETVMRVAVATFPLLADLYGQFQGGDVGTEEWRNARGAYLRKWMNEAAIIPEMGHHL